MKKIYTFFAVLISCFGFGQTVNDNFEDGDLTGWTEGSSNHWANSTSSPITSTRSLKHNLSGTSGSSYIYHDISSLNLSTQDITWEFNIKNGNWDPSSGNKFWVYLTANEPNLNSSTVDGYAVGVNLTGSSDILTLWKVTNGSADGAVITSSLNWNSNDLIGIRVTRSSTGDWNLLFDSDGGFDSLVSAGTNNNTDYIHDDNFGLSFTYSSTRAGFLWLDDVRVEGIIASSGPIIGFDTASSTENETNATFTSANIPITVSNYDGNQIDININATGGTAEAGDYTFTSPTALSFTADGTQNITVDINDDVDFDDETVELTITETSSVTGLVISQAIHTITIIDDETAPAPVTIWHEPFTDNTLYGVTQGSEGNGSIEDYFHITDGTNIDKSYTGNTGNFFAAQDIDDNGWVGSASPSQLTWSAIDVSIYTSLSFSGSFASVGGGIDASDFILVEYNIDGSGWTDILAFENSGGFNNNFLEDTDFNGTGDGTSLNSTFAEFTKSIPTNGSLLDLRITIAINSGDEDIALEDFKIEGIPPAAVDYTYNSGWSPSDPSGLSNQFDNILIVAGTTAITTGTDASSVTIDSGATLNINDDASITTASVTNNGTLTLTSVSNSYSSLITDAISGSGTVNYERYVNGNSTLGDGSAVGDNDLISPPLSGQTFGLFAAANTNLLENTGDATEKAFAIFDKVTGTYENYFTTTNAATVLDSKTGYRAATNTSGDDLVFTGTVETGTVSIDIVDSGASFSEWNLIGNPYPSYIDIESFLEHEVDAGVSNFDLLKSPTGIYGYDGDTSDGWSVITLANDDGKFFAPGQGFFVAADINDVAAYDIEFTAAMRTSGSGDDFIAGRNNNPLTFLKLNAATANNNYNTEFYFDADASEALDAGYDAVIWSGNAPSFALFSHLVEDNTGLPIALQALGATDYNNVIIPLGVNANEGEQLTFSISETTLPASVNVFLEDNVANTSTLLNAGDYVLTPSTPLNGTGRFYLNFTEGALSTTDTTFNDLSIYTNLSNKTIVISGQLTDNTLANVYDIQGRLIISQQLNIDSRLQAIDASTLNTGVYIVKLSNGSQNKTEKVIIK